MKKKNNFLALLCLVVIFFVLADVILLTHRQKNISPVSSVPKLTSTQTLTWKTYKNQQYQFTIEYPSNWTVNENKNNNIIAELADGGEIITISLSEPEKPCGEYSGISQPKTITINQHQFQYYEMEAGICAGLTTSIFKTKTNRIIYISNIGYSEQNNEIIKRIINSFTYLSTSNYTCPAGEWVDCMPSSDPVKKECQPAYLNWAKTNCPGFKGAVL